MANRQKYPLLQLRGSGYKFAEMREPGDPIIEIGFINIDRSVFKKSTKEKEVLKLAKIQSKIDQMKKVICI